MPVQTSPVVKSDVVQIAVAGTENPKSRHFRALLNKYTVGLHSIRRSQVSLGKNTRVVTQEGIMKVVN